MNNDDARIFICSASYLGSVEQFAHGHWTAYRATAFAYNALTIIPYDNGQLINVKE